LTLFYHVFYKNQKKYSKKILFFLTFFLISATFTILALEVIFSFLPVYDPMIREYVDINNPIARLKNKNQNLLYSRSYDFSNRHYKKVNNDGFFNDKVYKQRKEPIFAVIGDSFIEAVQVKNSESLTGLLQENLQNKGHAYSFGLSGAPMSQYLKYAEYAISQYEAEYLIINIVSNDFHESLEKYNKYPGYHYFSDDINNVNSSSLILYDYKSKSLLYRLLRSSALVRYLVRHLKILERFDQIFQKIKKVDTIKDQYVGAIETSKQIELLLDSKRAVNIFFKLFSNHVNLEKEKIVFLLDANRPLIYSDNIEAIKNSYYYKIKKYFKERAKVYEYEIVDLDEWFTKDFEKYNLKFEFPDDGHWNKRGHKVASKALFSSQLISNFSQNK